MAVNSPDNASDLDTVVAITLIAINQRYWLFEGEEYLNSLMMGQGDFPKPVKCVYFEDSFALKAYVGTERVLADFWGINPDIVERLRRDDHLLEMPASSA